MANLNRNPYSFTSADAGATDYLATLGVQGRFKVHGIRWVGPTTAGHIALISDTAGRAIWHATASANGVSTESRLRFWLKDGLVITTLSSGTLYIYGE
jgi:hypothetical protein